VDAIAAAHPLYWAADMKAAMGVQQAFVLFDVQHLNK
jgi:hypothetical protein